MLRHLEVQKLTGQLGPGVGSVGFGTGVDPSSPGGPGGVGGVRGGGATHSNVTLQPHSSAMWTALEPKMYQRPIMMYSFIRVKDSVHPFVRPFLGLHVGLTLIAEARDHVFVVLENASGFGCHAFQPAVTQILIKFESLKKETRQKFNHSMFQLRIMRIMQSGKNVSNPYWRIGYPSCKPIHKQQHHLLGSFWCLFPHLVLLWQSTARIFDLRFSEVDVLVERKEIQETKKRCWFWLHITGGLYTKNWNIANWLTWTFFRRGTFNRSTRGVAALAFVLVHSDPFAFFAIWFVFLGACFGLAFLRV